MNFAFSNLLGAPYRGGTLLIHGNELLTSVGNRVGQVGQGAASAAAARALHLFGHAIYPCSFSPTSVKHREAFCATVAQMSKP
jgi:hypothetical protein